MADEAAKLKRLQFVEDYGKVAAGAATHVTALYERAKAVAPQFMGPYVSRVEDALLAYGAPALATASDTAEKLLRTADDQVDSLFLVSAKWLSLEPLRKMHATNLETYQAATSKYFALIASTTDWAAAKLSPDKSVQYAKELLQAALAKAEQAADPDAAVEAAHQAWTKFAAVPAVASVLNTTAPLTHKGFETFVALHDAVVKSPLYKRSLTLGASTLLWATSTTPYKLSAQYLYPYVQPMADPAISKLANSAVLSQAVGYWKPVALAVQ